MRVCHDSTWKVWHFCHRRFQLCPVNLGFSAIYLSFFFSSIRTLVPARRSLKTECCQCLLLAQVTYGFNTGMEAAVMTATHNTAPSTKRPFEKPWIASQSEGAPGATWAPSWAWSRTISHLTHLPAGPLSCRDTCPGLDYFSWAVLGFFHHRLHISKAPKCSTVTCSGSSTTTLLCRE